MSKELSGTPEEIRKEAEEIVQVIVPEARCEVHDYEHRIRCGLVAAGEKLEFSLLLEGLETDVLETHARDLQARLHALRSR